MLDGFKETGFEWTHVDVAFSLVDQLCEPKYFTET